MKLYCATTNPGKLREFRLIVQHFGAERVTVDTLESIRDIEPPEETGATFEENAAIKAVYYSRFASGPLFADDSGLRLMRWVVRQVFIRPALQENMPEMLLTINCFSTIFAASKTELRALSAS